MSGKLREIAIYVQEVKKGSFEWVLAESGKGGDWEEIQRAGAPAPSYRRAMAEGLMALQEMVPDLDEGPRSGHKHVDDGAATREAPSQPARREDAQASSPSPFGFGPAR